MAAGRRLTEPTMYAVIQTGGKQYRVEPEGVLSVERLDGNPGDIVEFTKVLMVGGEDSIDTKATGASVKAEILEHKRLAKILVFKKKRRKKYRRRAGHRQQQTVVRVREILDSASGDSA